MNRGADFLDLYTALTWRLWREQRRTIVLAPLLMTALFGAILLGTQFSPDLLTGPTRHALRAAMESDGHGAAGPPGSLARAFIEHQAPYLLALLSGLSAASVSARLVGDEADRGSLELLLATRHGVRSIGGAMLLAAGTLSALGWAILATTSAATIAALDAALDLHVSISPAGIGTALAMQFILALVSAELAIVVILLVPALARAPTGLAGNPTSVIGALPALCAFLAANLLPGLSVLRLSLAAMIGAALLLVLGAAALRSWFRPERFLES